MPTQLDSCLQQFWWEIVEHLAYSPDLAPSDYHLFFYPKGSSLQPQISLSLHLVWSSSTLQCRGNHKFQSDDDVKTAVMQYLRLHDTDFCQEEIEKLILWYRCVSHGEDYI